MSRPLLQSRELGKIHRVGEVEVHALRGVTLDVHKGEFVSIVGPSGSGKSTLVNIWGMLDTRTSGEYIFDGADVGKLSHDARATIRNRKFGFVFQSYNLLARSTAIENVELPLTYADVAPDERYERSIAALQSVGMEHRHAHWPHQLSGGEQQRVAIARALVNDPLLIFADEPTGAIDQRNGSEVLRQLHHLNAMGRTVVLVTHDPNVARHAQRIVTLEDGRVRHDSLSSKQEYNLRRQQESLSAHATEL
jgi:putative ABC transport system ATP-binding protein